MDSNVLGRIANTAFYIHKNKIKGGGQFIESFRPGQIKSKSWLVDEVCNFNMEWNNVLVLGSWNSILLWELFNEQAKVTWFDFVDTDPTCHYHRDLYFEQNELKKNYSNIIMDATEFSDHKSYDLIINTSCEHMKDIPAVNGPLYALQSNNQFDLEEHINCVKSPEQLATQNRITDVRYKGELDLNNKKRFMVIGQYW